MAIKILMPALSPTMTEGTLASWLKKEGDAISAGDVIAEIETDKATMEVEAVDEGVLGKIIISEGAENVPVNEPIAILLEEGEDESAIAGALNGGGAAAPAPTPANDAPANDAPANDAPASAPAPSPAAAPAADHGGDRLFASPLARRIAKDAGLDLAAVTGSGPNGRIIKADVEASLAGGVPAPAAAASAPTAAPSPAPKAAPSEGPSAAAMATAFGQTYTEVKNSNMRKTVARRLTEAKQTIPHFYLTVDCELDALLSTRKEVNDRAPEGVKVSVNDMIIKAVALALRKVPEANASWTDEAILLYDDVDVSVAVAIDGGLITPIIKKADTKGLATISSEMKDLAGRAREGKLQPEEYQGGGFSVSNLGMFGVKHFDAIINPPQGCILAVGAGEQRAVVKDGALAIATVMSCTLSVDHRVVDGAVGAQFLQAFKGIIQDPLTMLL
ncbi:MAG: pyruvate dehydrogenase complex dihydrolipoamide acetyltransferase [Pseudomonadota bacterium]